MSTATTTTTASNFPGQVQFGQAVTDAAIPPGLTSTETALWHAALFLQRGDPAHPVWQTEIAEVARVHYSAARTAIRRLRNRGPGYWPFPCHGTGQNRGYDRADREDVPRALPSVAEMAAAKLALRADHCTERAGRAVDPAVLTDDGEPPRPWKSRMRAVDPVWTTPEEIERRAVEERRRVLRGYVEEARQVVQRLRRDWEAARVRKATGLEN